MPNLPTLTLTQTQFDRCLAAFTDATTYKAWLKARLVDEVTRVELAAIADSQNATRAAIVNDIATNVLP